MAWAGTCPRESQVPPEGDWWCWLILAGRGWGKTRCGAEWVIERAREGKGPIALIGETYADVRDTMVELGPSSILAVSPPDFRPKYIPGKRRLLWPNGVTGTTFAGDFPDQLRGPQHQTVWCDEPAKWRKPAEAWSNMEFGLRVGSDPRACATTTPRPLPFLKALLDDKRVVVTSGSTFENVDNLSPVFMERLKQKYEGTRLGRQELYAEILSDLPDALWAQKTIDDCHVDQAPVLGRIAVAVDPGVSQTAESNETGILVGGTTTDAHSACVLEDASGVYSPNQWAEVVVGLVDKWSADVVVAEVNNGGDLVEANLRTVDPKLTIRKVHASRGKHIRAEPVASLYEQGRVKHLGTFGRLEDQLMLFTTGGYVGLESPDRADALVWLMTELMLSRKTKVSPVWGRV